MDKVARFIVLKRQKYSEADLIIHGIEPSGVRIHCLARGALKSRKRFGGGLLEPTHYLEGQVKLSPNPEGLHTLQDARMLEDFDGLRSDYDRLNLSLRFLDTIDKSNPGEVFPEIFNLLGNSLRSLANGGSLSRIEMQFGLKFLKLHGVLEMDGWMGPFLEKPIAISDEKFGTQATANPAHQRWLWDQIKAYL